MKNMTKYSYMLLALLVVSCEEILFENDQSSENPQANLDYLWSECDEKYAYFDLKSIDWQAIKREHEALLFEGMSDDSLFQVLGSMLRQLRDDHTNLISDFNISFFAVDNLGPDNFDWRIITDNYLPRNYYISGPFQHDFIANGRIGYVRFPAFTGIIDETNFDFVLERYKNTDGLILDLRENGGGAVTDVFELLSRFVETETITNYSRIKNGPGHNDFSEAEPAKVKPYDGIRYQRPVAMLIDRGTYSAGSFTSLASKALPNITLIGDTTGGGLGLPNGGQLPNGWLYRFSVTQALTLDMDESYENGVPPDIYATLDKTVLTTDEVLETAIEHLLR